VVSSFSLSFFVMGQAGKHHDAASVVDIPNGYTSDVVSYGGGMADSQPGGLVAMPWQILRCHAMADSQTAGAYGRFYAAMPWQIPRRQELMADSTLPRHGGLLDAGAYGGSEDRPMAGCLVVHA
jgi:hypothetical protein